MATMKDVAKEAGVSTATVSFYLNNKPVSEEKSLRVAEAIRKLNYVVHASGRDLRTKNSNIGIILPNIYEPYYEKIINSLKGFLTYRGKEFSLELTDDNPERETQSLMSFIGRKSSGIVLYSCQPDNQEAFEMLDSSGIPYVLIDRRPEGFECNFVSCDNYSLFYTLTNHLVSQGKHHLALVCGPQNYTENENARNGFLHALADNDIPTNPSDIIHTTQIRENGFLAGTHLLETSSVHPSAVLTTSYKLAEGLRYAFMMNRIDVGKDVSIITSGDSENDVFYYDPTIIKTSRSAFEIGETAGRLLLENIKSPVIFEKQQKVIKDTIDIDHLFDGNTFITRTKPSKSQETINVLLPDDKKTVSSLPTLLVDFYSKEDIKVNFIYVSIEECYQYILDNINSDSNVDAMLFDIPWLQFFVKSELLLCLDDYFANSALNTSQYIPNIFEHFSKVNGHYYTLPFISSTQLMFYRKDLFSDEHVLRQFENQFKIPLLPPRTWLEFVNTAKFFTRSINPLSPVEYGTALDFLNPTLVLCNFLPRLWAYGGDLYNKQGRPSLNTPAAKKAISNLLDSVSAAHPDIFGHPVEAVDKLINGQAAMMTTFFNYATDIVDRDKSSVIGKIGYTRIPGSTPVMGGWCFGVSKYSKSPDAAYRFIEWATSADIAVAQTILGGQSPQLNTYKNYDMLSLYPWLSKALTEFSYTHNRQSPTENNMAKYSEKFVEGIVSTELYKLLHRAAEGDMPNASEIQESLYQLEEKFSKL